MCYLSCSGKRYVEKHPCFKAPGAAKFASANLLGQTAMQKVIKHAYDGKSWKNVVSIGDGEAEFNAMRDPLAAKCWMDQTLSFLFCFLVVKRKLDAKFSIEDLLHLGDFLQTCESRP